MLNEEEDRFLTDDEDRQISGLSRSTRWRKEKAGTYPARIPISQGRSARLLSEVRAWRDEQIQKARLSQPPDVGRVHPGLASQVNPGFQNNDPQQSETTQKESKL